jgi:uncharacterized membrane protein YeaQ/YmgE (transglycosylase-associated protein family)
VTLGTILWIALVGLVAGAIARLLVPGRDPIGCLGTMAVGVVGAFLGWFVGRELVGRHEVIRHPWISAILGAVVVLLVIRLVSGRGGRRWGRPAWGRRWGW